MARRDARTDANQTELVKVLGQLGATVENTSGAHNGFTDIVVGLQGVTVLVEIKDGAKVPSARKLTPAQIEVHDRFTGAITVIETVDQAVMLVNRMREAAERLHGIDWYMGAVANAPENTPAKSRG